MENVQPHGQTSTEAVQEHTRSSSKEDDRRRKWEMAYKARMRQIVPGLFLGNVEASHNRAMLLENRITAIVSLTDARWAWWNGSTRRAGVPENRHKWVQCVDSSTQDLIAHMADICDFIDRVAAPALADSSSLPTQGGKGLNDEARDAPCDSILVHCDLGISRSPTVIIAYLMRKYGIEQDEALNFVQTRQKVKPSTNLTRQLNVWGDLRFEIWEDKERTIAKASYQAFLEDRAVLLKKKGLTGNEPLAPLSL